jgi:hypothetical protein
VFGAGAVTETDETVWIDTGTVPLNLMTPEDARAVFAGVDASFIDRPMLAGIGFEVADAAACAAVLRGNGVAVHEDGEILRVGPEAGCGAVLEFS